MAPRERPRRRCHPPRATRPGRGAVAAAAPDEARARARDPRSGSRWSGERARPRAREARRREIRRRIPLSFLSARPPGGAPAPARRRGVPRPRGGRRDARRRRRRSTASISASAWPPRVESALQGGRQAPARQSPSRGAAPWCRKPRRGADAGRASAAARARSRRRALEHQDRGALGGSEAVALRDRTAAPAPGRSVGGARARESDRAGRGGSARPRRRRRRARVRQRPWRIQPGALGERQEVARLALRQRLIRTASLSASAIWARRGSPPTR